MQQLDAERCANQTLSQQLVAEVALRQKSDAYENARGKEVQAREREIELGERRLQTVQGELQRAREEARLAREALGDARATAIKMERERDAEREDTRRERARPPEREVLAHGQSTRPARSCAPLAGPSLQRDLPTPTLPFHSPQPAQMPAGQAAVFDELSRSDLWNFSAGALSRVPIGARVAGVATQSVAVVDGTLPRISSPFNTATNQLGLATSLDPEAARQLYGTAAQARVPL